MLSTPLEFLCDEHRDDGSFAAQVADTLTAQLSDRQWCNAVQSKFGNACFLLGGWLKQDILGE